MRKTEIYANLIESQNYKCGICDESLLKEYELYQQWLASKGQKKPVKRSKINLDIDHKIPKSKLRGIWWRNNIINLQLTHKSCNNKKGNKQ